jgi:hypothetical protein
MNNIINDLQSYMFTEENMEKFSQKHKMETNINNNKNPFSKKKEEVSYTLELATNALASKNVVHDFLPAHKDKLFWCFYYLYKGEHEYEQHIKDNFITEKNFKIETAEKVKLMKNKLKLAKLKMSEIEDEFINKQQITLKGLHALCIIYDVSLIYEFNKKYSEYLYNSSSEEGNNEVIEIITLKEKGEYALKCFSEDEEGIKEKEKYIKNIRDTYWKIDNADKPLKVPSAYTIKELQEIAEKLGIILMNELGKNKTKPVLYQEILTFF